MLPTTLAPLELARAAVTAEAHGYRAVWALPQP